MRFGIVAGLVLLLSVIPVAKAEDDTVTVRVTFYTLHGCMASSGIECNYTHKDAAACSRQYPFGTQFQFQDGYVVTCEDRGRGDHCPWERLPGPCWYEWIDVWSPSYSWGITNVERDYGLHTDVTIIRWGWE